MVISLSIALFIAVLAFFYMGKSALYYREAAEEYRELYEQEQDFRMELYVKLQDSQAHVSNLIARNVQAWATEEVKKVH